MNLRQLRKQDKRAAAILIAAYRYHQKDFGEGHEGRHSYWYMSSPMDDEWDEKPALEVWEHVRGWEHRNAPMWYGFDPATGKDIPKDQRPRGMTRRESQKWFRLQPPFGFRWRGKRLVRVVYTRPIPGLPQHNAVIPIGSHIDQRIPRITSRAKKETAVLIHVRISGLKHNFQPATYTFPHSNLPKRGNSS